MSPSMWKRTSRAVSRKSGGTCQQVFITQGVELLNGVKACSYSRRPRRSGLSLVSLIFKHEMEGGVRLTVIVADAAIQVDLRVDVLAALTSNAASEDAAVVDADAGDLAGVVEVRHDESGEGMTCAGL